MINRYRNVFLYVFAMFQVQEVSLSLEYCGSHWCFDGRCCFDTCCPKLPEMPSMDNSFVIPVAIFGAFGGFVFIVVVCIICYNIHKKSRERRPEITRTQPIPPPAFVPPGPTAPPLILASDPPPYSEVIGKSDFFPAPVGQPPCYDNIAMEDLSSMEGARPPGSRLTD